MQEFQIGQRRFKFGPAQKNGNTVFSPLIETLAVWLWNGYYWGIELVDCEDLESAKKELIEKYDG